MKLLGAILSLRKREKYNEVIGPMFIKMHLKIKTLRSRPMKKLSVSNAVLFYFSVYFFNFWLSQAMDSLTYNI